MPENRGKTEKEYAEQQIG